MLHITQRTPGGHTGEIFKNNEHLLVSYKLALACQLQIGTCLSTTNWHLPRALPVAEQQGHLPSAETEPCAAAAGDLQQPGREIRAEGGTLCSRESGGTDI